MSKKTLIGIGLLIAIIMLFLVGCEHIDRLPEDERPDMWNVDDHVWEEMETGEIEDKILYRHDLCDRYPPCSENCLKHGSYFELIFTNGNRYSIGQVRRYGIIEKGRYGTLYKYDVGSPDDESWFQFVLKNNSEKTAPPIAYSQKIEEKTKNSWENAKNVLPKPHITVIVKLKGDIITTAHVNQKKDWKLESNKEKTLGGPSLYSVIEWRELILE